MKWRNVVFVIIFIICIFSVVFSVYWQFYRKENIQIPQTPDIEEAKVIKDFNQIFNNQLNYQGYTIMGLNRIDQTKDIIYTSYIKQEKNEEKYELNVNIPAININNDNVVNINNQIENIFKTKAISVLIATGEKTIYSVEYTAYINSNILSLVIKSTLKEGSNPQRVIVKTYNYNLSTGEELTLAQIIDIKELSSKVISNEIKEKIQEANQRAIKLKELGYNVYTRDLTSGMYEINTTSNYFLGMNNMLYIIYPYGNQNNTSEMDVILFE